jgi:hypothetical protein
VSPSPPLRWALFGALAAAALLATSCTGAHTGRRSAPSTAAPSTSTTEPAPQYAPSPLVWTREESPALALGGGPSATLTAVLAPELSGAWLVFGSRTGADDVPTATVWSSPDALHWTAAPLAGAGPGAALAAARYKSATVVVGSTGSGATQQAAAWLSTADGTPFVAQEVTPSDGPSRMTLVTAGALGTFAAGTVDGRFALWGSSNGRRWTELSGAEKVIAASPGARIDALLAVGDYVYAAGSVQDGPGTDAAVWATANGFDWHLVTSAATSFTGPGSRVIYSLAPLGSGLVAVGAISQGTGWVPASWISPDGESWSLPSGAFTGVPRTTASAAAYGPSGGTAARSVTAIPTLAGSTILVAAGGGPSGQAVWRSTDGLHWARLPLPAATASSTAWQVGAAASTVTTTVVLDTQPGEPYLLTDQPASAGAAPAGGWSQPSDNPAVFGPIRPVAVPVSLRLVGDRLELTVEVLTRPQEIGNVSVRTEVLASADGHTWTAVQPTGLPASLPTPGAFAVHLPSGWVAVSSGTASPPRAWVSASGRAWRAVAVLPVAGTGTPGTTAPTTAATGGSSSSRSGAAAKTAPATVNGLCVSRLRASTYGVAPVGSLASTAISGSGATAGTVAPIPVTTRAAAAWVSTTATVWRSAPVASPPPPGSVQSMSGCVQTPSGLLAFGTATSSTGSPEPALWHSANGASWTRLPVAAFAAGTPGPLVSVATAGQYGLAVASPDPATDPLRPAGPGPAATAATDAAVGPPPSLEDGREGLWLSLDGGTTWQQLDTSVAPWLGSSRSQLSLVGFAGGTPTGTGSSTTAAGTGAGPAAPVVVGTVDGALAIWTAAASAGGAGSTTTTPAAPSSGGG